jgi:hypothetical protein
MNKGRNKEWESGEINPRPDGRIGEKKRREKNPHSKALRSGGDGGGGDGREWRREDDEQGRGRERESERERETLEIGGINSLRSTVRGNRPRLPPRLDTLLQPTYYTTNELHLKISYPSGELVIENSILLIDTILESTQSLRCMWDGPLEVLVYLLLPYCTEYLVCARYRRLHHQEPILISLRWR